MENLDSIVDDNATSSTPMESTQEMRQQSIQRCIQSIEHCVYCLDPNCNREGCKRMKRVISHTKDCKRKTAGGCPICKQLIALCCYHSKNCQNGSSCPMPFCCNIKDKLKLATLQNRLQEARKIRRSIHSGLGQRLASQGGPGAEAQTSLRPCVIRGPQNQVITSLPTQHYGNGLEPGTSQTSSSNLQQAVNQEQDEAVGQQVSLPGCSNAIPTLVAPREQTDAIPLHNARKVQDQLFEKKIMDAECASEEKENEETQMLEVKKDCYEKLECPVCHEYLSAPIIQCSTGHSLCSPCRSRIERCPLCFQPFTTARNFTLEQIVESMKLPCKYSLYGCDATVFLNNKNEHENACHFQK